MNNNKKQRRKLVNDNSTYLW